MESKKIPTADSSPLSRDLITKRNRDYTARMTHFNAAKFRHTVNGKARSIVSVAARILSGMCEKCCAIPIVNQFSIRRVDAQWGSHGAFERLTSRMSMIGEYGITADELTVKMKDANWQQKAIPCDARVIEVFVSVNESKSTAMDHLYDVEFYFRDL